MTAVRRSRVIVGGDARQRVVGIGSGQTIVVYISADKGRRSGVRCPISIS